MTPSRKILFNKNQLITILLVKPTENQRLNKLMKLNAIDTNQNYKKNPRKLAKLNCDQKYKNKISKINPKNHDTNQKYKKKLCQQNQSCDQKND